MSRVLILILSLVSLAGFVSASAQSSDINVQIQKATSAFVEAPSTSTRAALVSELSAYQGPPTVQSINGHLSLLMYDAPSEDFPLILPTARAATAHLEPVADRLPKQYLDARFIAAVAAFNAEKDENAAYEMAHIQGMALGIEPDGVWPDWAKSTHYQAKAWALAMLADLKADRRKSVSQDTFDDILAAYPARKENQTASDALPLCEGKIRNRSRIQYPSLATRRGQWGALILEYDLNAEGRVINETVAAAVPEGFFEEESLEWVKKGRFRPKKPDEAGINCRIERRGIVQDLVFQLR
jgi:TonB family protein